MSLEIVTPESSPGDQACRHVAGTLNGIAAFIETQLTSIVNVLADRTVAESFWQLQGANGVNALTAFASARGLLQQIAPSRVSAELAAAGSTLIVDQQTGIVSLAPIE